MVLVLIPWVCFSVLFCLALLRAAVRPPPEFEEHGIGPATAIPDAMSAMATTESQRAAPVLANAHHAPVTSMASQKVTPQPATVAQPEPEPETCSVG